MRQFVRTAINLGLGALLAVACSGDDPTANPSIASVGVLESNVLVGLYGARTLTPVARDASNRTIEGTVFTWTSSDVSTATVDNDGVVRGLRLGGPVTITATTGGKSGSVTVFVTPAGVTVSPGIASLAAGDTAQFSASAVDANGAPIEGMPVQWSLAFNANTSTAAAISQTGIVTAISAGIVIVQANISGRTGSTSFGIPSALDGLWTGKDGASRPIEMEVRFGLIIAFRMPSIPEPGCSDKSINATINGSPIAANGNYEFPIGLTPFGTVPALVRGTFTTTTTATGSVPGMDLGLRTCNDGASLPSALGPTVFTITHR
jgi:hypothetical protein